MNRSHIFLVPIHSTTRVITYNPKLIELLLLYLSISEIPTGKKIQIFLVLQSPWLGPYQHLGPILAFGCPTISRVFTHGVLFYSTWSPPFQSPSFLDSGLHEGRDAAFVGPMALIFGMVPGTLGWGSQMNRKPLVCKAQKRTEKKGWACPLCAETYVRSQTDKPLVTRIKDRRTIPRARSHGLKQGPIFLGSRRGSVRGSTTSQKGCLVGI